MSDEDEYLNNENDPQVVEKVTDDEVVEDIENLDDDDKVVASGSDIIKSKKKEATPAGFLFAKKEKR